MNWEVSTFDLQKTKRGVSMGSQQGAKRGKWLKRVSIVIVVLLSVLLLLPQAGKYARYRSKENIKSLVINNLVFLDEAAGQEAFEDPLTLKGVQRRSFWQNDHGDVLVEYFCRGYGIVPSSVYTGFYYTSADGPVGYEGSAYPLNAMDKGWKWQETDGDNWYYTEKIADHWYYYEAGF